MSKIEKALQKALQRHDLPERATPAAPADARSGALVAETSSLAVGSIRLMAQPLSFSPAERALKKIIVPDQAEHPTVKAFRELRTNIAQRTGTASSIIMVTGSARGGGATFVATNLAAAIAFESGRTALLIDCNLARPSLQRLLPAVNGPGLVDYLESERLDVNDIIHPSGVERLRVIPVGGRGSANAEYFTMGKMRQLLEALKTRYPDRQIIIDAPPITSSADSQILGALCDHIVLVVPYGRVTEGRLLTALKGVEAKKVVGMVFNDDPALPPMRWSRALAGWWLRLLKRAPEKQARPGQEIGK